MELKDIYELRLGQEIWYKGDKKIIKSLMADSEGYHIISFEGMKFASFWNEICKDCSLTPPKKKVKKTFYQGIYSIDKCSGQCTTWYPDKKQLYKVEDVGNLEYIIEREFEVEE